MSGTKEFVGYLNTLHSYYAQNQNAYAEQNFKNRFYQDMMVKIGVTDFIVDKLKTENPQVVILTGHAGDGKTSIMYQVLEQMGVRDFASGMSSFDVNFLNGRHCRCIKDFSELNSTARLEIFRDAAEYTRNGNFVFMVANTGPLITTFQEFCEPSVREEQTVSFIGMIEKSSGEQATIQNLPISAINLASVDNTQFAKQFLSKMTGDLFWGDCAQCLKREFCHIKLNRELIIRNRDQVDRFLNEHYMWLAEHGNRLTVRSISEQLSYMLTGGDNCEDVYERDRSEFLFSNLFFGYRGRDIDEKALNLPAVRAAYECHYDRRKLKADETILLEKDYSQYFGTETAKILDDIVRRMSKATGLPELIRRTYLFLNIRNDDAREKDIADIFSSQYARYIKLTCTDEKVAGKDNSLITEALIAVYLGSPMKIRGSSSRMQAIPITLSRESGLYQTVQLVTGTVNTKKVILKKVPTNEKAFHSGAKKYSLRLEVDKTELQGDIDLPLLDYFDEIRNGIISTDVDPVLTHGIENIKSQLSQIAEDDTEGIELYVMKNDGAQPITLEIIDGNLECDY